MTNKQWLDELVKRIAVTTGELTTVISSTPINLNIPRGYVAHIKHIEWQVIDGIGVFAIDATSVDINCAVVKDPDDALTTIFPENEPQHDVLDDFQIESHCTIAATSGVERTPNFKQRRFTEEEDEVSSRNMRLNGVCSTNTVIKVRAIIDYTLEKVTTNEILELLDIL